MSRSASSHRDFLRTRRSKILRTLTKTVWVRRVGSARGTTTVRIAEPRTPTTTAAPARKASTRAATTMAARYGSDRPVAPFPERVTQLALEELAGGLPRELLH